MTALLEVEDLRVAYGKIEAVKGISFTVEAGQVVTLIGTNGAGKTTTLRTLSGLLKPSGGRITFDGKPLSDIPAHKIVSLGLAHSPSTAYLPAADHRREPPARSVSAERQGGHREGRPARLRAVPHPGRTAQAGGRHAVGR